MTQRVNPLAAPSDLRARRVARTETEVVDAARGLFVQQGYVATTLAQVAQVAGVGARTVYVRFGTKAALFSRVVDEALRGEAGQIEFRQRPDTQRAMTAETLADRIEALAELSLGIADRVGALFEVAAQAEGVEPELAESAQAGRREARRLCRRFWERAAADGLASDALDLAHLAVVTDVLVCADTLVHLRRAHDWSPQMYRRVIIDTLTALARPAPPRA